MQAKAPEGHGDAGRTFERIAVVRELKGRVVPTSIVHAFAPTGAELAIDETYKTGSALDAGALTLLESDARTAMSLRHPNVAAVRDVWRQGTELHVTSEAVEGETLEEMRRLAAGGADFGLEVGVRVVVDVLAALSAMHALGGGGLAHGEVTATNVIVGFDGTSRLLRPYRGRIAGKVAEPDWFSYAAPELVRGGPANPRADVFAVGVLLWEALSRRKLFPKATRDGRLARSVPVGKPVPPAEAPWAAPLAAVVERALAYDTNARYGSAAEMAAAVRLAVRSKLAMPPRVAAAVDKLAGARIVERRTQNALPEVVQDKRPSLRPSVPDQAVKALASMRPSTRPPPPKPAVAAAADPVIPKAPLLPTPEPPTSIKKTHTGPRPFAPPLQLAPPPVPPTPPPPREEAPVSLDADAAFIEEPPAPLPVPSVQAATSAPIVIPALPRGGNRRTVVLAVAGLALILLVSVVSVALLGSRGSSVAATPSVSSLATKPPPPVVSTAQPAVSATAPVPSETAAASVSAPPETSSVAPETTAAPEQPPHEPSHRTRPRPTYDPMGI